MKTSLLGYFLCGGVIVLVVASLVLVSGDGVPTAGALASLLLVGGVLPLASAVWGSAFRRR